MLDLTNGSIIGYALFTEPVIQKVAGPSLARLSRFNNTIAEPGRLQSSIQFRRDDEQPLAFYLTSTIASWVGPIVKSDADHGYVSFNS